jgi:hypothetical protein
MTELRKSCLHGMNLHTRLFQSLLLLLQPFGFQAQSGQQTGKKIVRERESGYLPSTPTQVYITEIPNLK